MKDIKIDPEFAALMRPLSEDEERNLRNELAAHGCLSPLVVWREEQTLLDGHNRKRICDEEGIDYEITEVDLDARNQALAWICKNQLGRRNLTPNDFRYFLGKRWNITEKTPGARTDLTSCQNDGRLTAADIAKEHGVSEATVRRAAKFAEQVDALPESERVEVLAGRKDFSARVKSSKPSGPPQDGMGFARAAILSLEQIKFDDAERHQAFDLVRRWIDERY